MLPSYDTDTSIVDRVLHLQLENKAVSVVTVMTKMFSSCLRLEYECSSLDELHFFAFARKVAQKP